MTKKQLTVPLIGIGAGSAPDAQVLVMHDMLGIHLGKPAKFVKNFLKDSGSIEAAFGDYRAQVQSGAFPGSEHSFS